MRKPMDTPTSIGIGGDAGFKALALLLSVNCVRNTVIEDYHAGTEETSQISDDEMKAFNIEVADKLYTALKRIFSGDEEDKLKFINMLMWYWPSDWYEPELDEGLEKSFQTFKQISDKREAT